MFWWDEARPPTPVPVPPALGRDWQGVGYP